MRLLLVEDKVDFAADVEKAVRAIPGCDFVWVASRDSALARLQQEHFDLVVLDRSIPTADGVLDDHHDHGWRVFQYVKEQLSGVPVWFLTGAEDHDFAAEMNNDHGRSADLHGTAQHEPMYLVCWKKKIADCVRRIQAFANQRSQLQRIAVRSAQGLNLRPEEDIVLRTFARRHDGVSIDIVSLNGGLSRSRVLKAIVRNAHGGSIISAAAKISELSDIDDEDQRYRTDISRLTPGGFPSLTDMINVGAGKYGGLFYGMVGSSVESLFSRLAAGHADVGQVPSRLRSTETPWYGTKQSSDVQVGQIRRRLIGDVAFHSVRDQLQGIDVTAVEARVVRAGQCTQHGDLHCANVVFAEGGLAMVIDFGDTGQSFSALDPVTLELSTIFHAQHATLPVGWPTEAIMANWVDVDQFVQGCAFGPFIVGCREWALAEAASPEEVVATAYAYAIRQLKYDDTNKALLRALIRACIARLTA